MNNIFQFARRMVSMLVIVTFLGGCFSTPFKTSTNSHVPTSPPMNAEELQAYIEQWQSSLEKVERLAVLEDDLALIVEEIGKATDINAMPSQYANFTQTDIYEAEHVQDDEVDISHTDLASRYEKAKVIDSNYSPELPEMAKSSTTDGQHYAVHLAFFLQQRSAQLRWEILNKEFPVLLNKLNPKIEQVNNKNQALYSLKLGPLDSIDTANLLCQFFNRQHYKCLPSAILDSTT